MIVDPNTGEILQISQPTLDAQSMAGQIGMDVASNAGYGPESAMMGMLSNLPNATTSMFWNARRGSNTIQRGGFSSNPANNGKFARNHLSPRSFGRMSSIYNVDPAGSPHVNRRFGRSGTRAVYSPLNTLARGGNAAAGFGMRKTLAAAVRQRDTGQRSVLSGIHQRLGKAKIINSSSNVLLNHGYDAPVFSSGVAARVSTASRIASGGRINPSRILESVSQLDRGLGAQIGSRTTASRSSLAHFTGASMQGTASQQFSGYMTSSMVGGPNGYTSGILQAAGKESYLQGASSATRHLAAGGLEARAGRGGLRIAAGELGDKLAAQTGKAVGDRIGLRGMGAAARLGGAKTAGVMGARMAGLAIPGVNIAMTAMLAYDLTKMGMAAMTGLAETAKDAGHSFKGSIDKPVMGMGYKDNTVAATSRSRGVMAIQNSRLNARSVLGTEAGSMHAHFG